jgi:Zn-dependent protease with chaperone function
VTLNTANRAFVGIVAVAAAVAAVFVVTACWVFSMVAYKIATDGAATLTAPSTIAALVLIALLVTSSVLAVRSLRRQVANTHRLRRWVKEHRASSPPSLCEAASAAGLDGCVDLVDAAGAFSFAYGIARPRVALSRDLLESVSAEELAAVLEHERYHVANYDPLKVVLARSVPDALFFVPALRELRERYVAARELAADRRAMRRTAPASVAGALYKVIAGPTGVDLATAAAIGGDEALDARVDQLERGSEPPLPALSRPGLVASIGGASVLAGSAVASFATFGPLMAKICMGR